MITGRGAEQRAEADSDAEYRPLQERELAQLLRQKRKEEHLGADVRRLQDQRTKLEEELTELRRAISRMRRRR